MADKKINIPIGDGVTVPAWATDVTAEAMVLMTQRTNVVLDDMMGGVKDMKELDEQTLAAIKKTIEGVDENQAATANAARDKAEMVLAGANHVKNVANFFGNSEKPLSGMVNAMEKLTDNLTGPKAASNKKSAMNKVFTKFPLFAEKMKDWGGAAGIASDMIFAWAGWNAAKFEQFAEVQAKMINNGAIMFETGKTFDDLYKSSFNAGVTYNAFADTVSNFGGTMVALGGDTSKGSVKFLGLFKSLQDSTNSMGDLGMQNKEMMETYAQYIESIRLTGSMESMLANNGEKLESSFQRLVVESTALASLTSLDRSEAMQAYTSAMSEPFMAAANKRLRDRGMDATADIGSEMGRTFKLLAMAGGEAAPMFEGIFAAFSQKYFDFAGGGQKFDMRAMLAAQDTNLPAVIDRLLGESAISDWESMINEGKMLPGEVSAKLREMVREADTDTGYINAGAQVGGMVDSIYKGQLGLIQLNQDMGAWLSASNEEFEAKVKGTYGKLEESGTTVEAMNDMSKAFLTAQELLTLDIQQLSTSVKAVSTFLRKGVETGAEGVGSIIDYFMSDDDSDVPTTDSNTNNSVPGVPDAISGNVTGPEVAQVKTKPTVTALLTKVDKINEQLYNSDKDLNDSERIFLEKKKAMLEQQIEYLRKVNINAENENNAKIRSEYVSNHS